MTDDDNDLTEDEFFAIFRPEEDPDENTIKLKLPKDREWIDLAIKENRIWTMLECDGKLIISSGFHVVNSLYYLATEVSWGKEYDVIVLS